MKSITGTLLVTAAAAVFTTVAGAQTWRTFDASRGARDSQPVSVHVRYAAGRIRVQPASAGKLYEMHMRFDAESVEPIYRYVPETRSLEVGVARPAGKRGFRLREGSDFQLQLSNAVPMQLQLDIGAAESDFDLSGLQLEQLTLQTGATDTRVRFEAPNPRRLRTMNLQVGAASVNVVGLGHANVEHIDLNLGVGQATLDFGGEWRGDMNMSLSSALGSVTVRVPANVGISVESSAFLHSLDATDMVKVDGRNVSSNWDTAAHKLRIDSNGALGRLRIERIGR